MQPILVFTAVVLLAVCIDGAFPCIGTDQRKNAYILGRLPANPDTDYFTDIADLTSLMPILLPLNVTQRNASIAGTCVASSLQGLLYVVGGELVYPALYQDVNGVSVFNLFNRTWNAPIIFADRGPQLVNATSSRYLVAIADTNDTNTWLIFFDTSQVIQGSTVWWFYSSDSMTTTQVQIQEGTEIASKFTSMVFQNNKLFVFGASAVFSIDLQNISNVAPPTTLTLNFENFTFQDTTNSSFTNAPQFPAGPGQAVYAGDKIAFLSYIYNTITIFDTTAFTYTEPVPFPSQTHTDASGASNSNPIFNLKDTSAISLNNTLFLYNAVTDTFASFGLLTNHWHTPTVTPPKTMITTDTISTYTTPPSNSTPSQTCVVSDQDSCRAATDATPSSGVSPALLILGGALGCFALVALVTLIYIVVSRRQKVQTFPTTRKPLVITVKTEEKVTARSTLLSLSMPLVPIGTRFFGQSRLSPELPPVPYKYPLREIKPDSRW